MTGTIALPGDIATLQQTIAMLREIRQQDIEVINGLAADKQRLQAELDAERAKAPPPQPHVMGSDLVERLRAKKPRMSYGLDRVEEMWQASDLEMEAAAAIEKLQGQFDQALKSMACQLEACEALRARAEAAEAAPAELSMGSEPEAETADPERVYFRFVRGDAFGQEANRLRIRKWDTKPFDGAIEYVFSPAFHPAGRRETARQEAVRLIERAGLEMEEEYDLLVDDISETMLRFAAVPATDQPTAADWGIEDARLAYQRDHAGESAPAPAELVMEADASKAHRGVGDGPLGSNRNEPTSQQSGGQYVPPFLNTLEGVQGAGVDLHDIDALTPALGSAEGAE